MLGCSLYASGTDRCFQRHCEISLRGSQWSRPHGALPQQQDTSSNAKTFNCQVAPPTFTDAHSAVFSGVMLMASVFLIGLSYIGMYFSYMSYPSNVRLLVAFTLSVACYNVYAVNTRTVHPVSSTPYSLTAPSVVAGP